MTLTDEMKAMGWRPIGDLNDMSNFDAYRFGYKDPFREGNLIFGSSILCDHSFMVDCVNNDVFNEIKAWQGFNIAIHDTITISGDDTRVVLDALEPYSQTQGELIANIKEQLGECDHDWVVKGRNSHQTYYYCRKCKDDMFL